MLLPLCCSLHLPPPNHTHSPTSQTLTPHHHHLLHNKQLHAHLIKTNTTWNLCLKASAEGPHPINTLLLFNHISSNVAPDSFTVSYLLKSCIRLSDLATGRALHGYVEKLGFRSNVFLMNMILNMYATCGAGWDAFEVFDEMSEKDVVTWNTMMTFLVKRGDVDEGYGLFLRMPERNVRSWTVMISGFAQRGRAKEAVRLFLEMEEAGVRANEVTVVAVLTACADLGELDLGRRVHEYSSRSGFGRNERVCNTLIEMYVKCGCVMDARMVFDAMEDRSVVSWSVMISGLAMHGQADEALRLFDNMIETGMRPNHVTFVGLLHACSHMGYVDKGRVFFARMTADYGVVPRIEHYGCMVDLLSRAGLVKEAYEFIMDMTIKPNGVVWGALLGGCKVHRNIELAEVAIKHLAELDPLNDGYYIVLSNIYAEAQRWEDVVRVRKLMRDRGVKKTPGWSSITIDGVAHEFVAGDEAHPQAEEINQMWERLLERMKMKGYVPNTSVILLDIEEEQKEKFLSRHSEKLALVFGLMNMKPGTPIRIMKNLRVCEDCHAALKLVSEIANREIVVRDRNRFHCFKNGSCSCRDYW